MPARQRLPSVSSALVGRQREMVYITERLADRYCRLLTLVGPGGIGKTRLAIEVAGKCGDAFADGVAFVPLQPVETLELAVRAVADAAGLALDAAHDPQAQLLHHLRDRTTLLILDNLEHLPDAVDLIAGLLAAAPGLKILATSREGLNLRDEWRLPLEGLHYPNGEPTDAPEAYSAIALFVACARRERPDFSPDGQEQALVDLCRLVGGVPLALELAASWVRALPVADIVAQVGRGIDFLTTRWRDMPARHQSMRAVFDGSWQRLTDSEQAVFRSLAVFHGGFTAQAAAYVAGAALADVTALVDKSLVRVGADARCELHDLLRQYAAEKLDALPDERERALDRHSAFYTQLLKQWEPTSHLSGQTERLEELENVRAAWLRAVERRDRKALERAAPALHWLLHLQARHGEAMELFYRAEEAFKSVASTGDGRYILAIMPLYRVFFRPGRLVAARYPPVDIEATLALWETLDERPEHGLPLSRAMLGLANHGADPGRIAAVARKSLSFSERHGDRSGEAIALSTLATVSFAYYGDFDEAERLLQTALTIDLQIGFHLNARWVEDLLGTIAQLRGRYVEARDHFDACLVHHRAGNIAQMLDTHLFQLGELELELGNHASAMQHFAESLAVAERLQHAAQAASVLAGYGLEAAYRGDASAAAAFYAQSRACLNDHGIEVVEDTVDVLNVGLLALLLDDFAEARALFEAITQDAIARRDRVLMMRCYCRLGHALVGLDEQERARHALFGALHDATTFGADAVTLETLVGIAQLDCLPPDDAVALLSFVQSQAAANRYSRRLAGRCLARLAPEAGDAAAARGGALTFEAALALVAPFGFEVGADQQAANRDLVEPLSARELDVLVLIAEGLTNREIADRLFVGVSTIKKHINHIYGKLDVADRDGVLNRARALRLLP